MTNTSYQTTDSSLKIGFIGAGHIGGTLARLWARAGHPIFVSSRHPEKLTEFVNELGRDARKGTALDAAKFGDVILMSIPFGEMRKMSAEILAQLDGKIVIDTSNPYPERDGKDAIDARSDQNSSEVWLKSFLPGAKLVKAFNTIPSRILEENFRSNSTRDIGVPLASDDPEAFDVAADLVRAAGLVPVIVGNLDRVRDFDVGTPPYGSLAGPEVLIEMLPGARRAEMPYRTQQAS